MMTHSTETPDACVNYLTDEGYAPYDVAQARAEDDAEPVPLFWPDMKALLARERVLLEELVAIRKRIGH
mgnify:FL=1